MSDRDPIESVLGAWLRERDATRPDPAPVLHAVVERLPAGARRSSPVLTWMGGRGRPGLVLALAAAAALGAVGVMVAFRPERMQISGPIHASPSAVASPSHRPSAASTATPSDLPRSSPGRTIVVAADGSGDAPTVAVGVSLAQDGDRVVVRPGTYQGRIDVTTDIEIVGEGDPASIVIVAPREGDDRFYGIRFDGSDATLSNLSVFGAPDYHTAIIVEGGAPVLDGLIIGNPKVRGVVSFSGGSRGALRDSLVYGGVGGSGDGTLIEGNRFESVPYPADMGWGPAIGIGAGGSDIVRHNTVRGGDAGILVHGGAPVIADNDIEVEGAGVVVSAGRADVRDNVVGGGTEGIAVLDAAPTLRGNAVSAAHVGIGIHPGGTPTLERNRLTGNDVGVRVDNGRIVDPDGPQAATLRANALCGNGTDLAIAPAASLVREGDGACTVSSPSARPIVRVDPLDGLVLEPVEAGVARVIRDGAGHDLTSVRRILAGTDGTLWAMVGDQNGEDPGEALVLGTPGTLPLADIDRFGWSREAFSVGPDGALWIALRDRLVSWDGSAWTTYRTDPGEAPLGSIQVGDDGTVWAAAGRESPVAALSILRLDASGRATAVPLDAFLPADGERTWVVGLVPTPDGGAWLGLADEIDGSGEARLLRIVDGRTEPVEPAEGIDLAAMTAFDVGADGSLWAYRADRGDGPSLVRFDGQRWEAFTEDVPPMGAPGAWEGLLAAAPDGSVWVSISDEGGGLARFDGTTWHRYLAGRWLGAGGGSWGIGPDGTLWTTVEGELLAIRP